MVLIFVYILGDVWVLEMFAYEFGYCLLLFVARVRDVLRTIAKDVW